MCHESRFVVLAGDIGATVDVVREGAPVQH